MAINLCARCRKRNAGNNIYVPLTLRVDSKKVLKLALMGKPVKVIAKRMNVTSRRIQQIIAKECK